MSFQRLSERVEGKSRPPESRWKVVPVEDRRPSNSYHRVCYVFVAQAASTVNIDATTLWDTWDASPPTSEIMGTPKCISSRPTSATGCHFPLGTPGNLQSSFSRHFAEYNERRKEEQGRQRVKHGCSNNGRRGWDGGEKEGDRHSPYLRSPRIFQPWLRLRLSSVRRRRRRRRGRRPCPLEADSFADVCGRRWLWRGGHWARQAAIVRPGNRARTTQTGTR